MKGEEKIKSVLSKTFDLPEDVVLNLPHISLVGNLRLSVENHRGIIKYTSEVIKLRVYHGQILIKGKELVIESLEERMIIITGNIADLSFKLG